MDYQDHAERKKLYYTLNNFFGEIIFKKVRYTVYGSHAAFMLSLVFEKKNDSSMLDPKDFVVRRYCKISTLYKSSDLNSAEWLNKF